MNKGQLRERVKSGKIIAKEAHKELLKLRNKGEIVNDNILKWLMNFKGRFPTEVAEPSKRNKRRKAKKSNEM